MNQEKKKKDEDNDDNNDNIVSAPKCAPRVVNG